MKKENTINQLQKNDRAAEIETEPRTEFNTWDEFVANISDEKIKVYANEIENFDKPEITVEEFLTLKKKMNELEESMTNLEKKTIEKKLKIYKNRLDRRVNENFGALLRHLREKKSGYSLAEVERISGVSASYINRMEKGNRKAPSIMILEKIADAYKVDISVLMEAANLSTTNEERLVDINELLYSNNFSINGKIITIDEKKLLVEILTSIATSKWTADTKHIESINIVELVNKFKNVSI